MKYEVCRLRDFLVIALQQSVDRRTDGQTDGQTDGRTDKVITIGLPHLRWRGPNKAGTKVKEASVTILADFGPEFNSPFRWRSKHQTKNHSAYH